MSEATILIIKKKKLIIDRRIVEIRNHWNRQIGIITILIHILKIKFH